MALSLCTHNGPFHADDVLAAALIRVFLDPDASVTRSREPSDWAAADIVFDVGHVFDVSTRRFDHHQREYNGERSSAGMVLDYLQAEGRVGDALASRLRSGLVDYVDAVDTGRRGSIEGVPCFSSMVAVLNEQAEEDFDPWFERAASWAADVVQGMKRGLERANEAAHDVRSAMGQAAAAGHRTLSLPRYLKWKPGYFAAGGAEHPTQYVLFPGKADWRVVTIPIAEGSREDKRKLPEEWAGLEGEALAEAVGIEGSLFCHRNRFIAAFRTQDAALSALSRWQRR